MKSDDGAAKGIDHGVLLGDYVRRLRTDSGLKQEQLSERMGPEVEANWITKLENGTYKRMIGQPRLGLLARALGVSEIELLRGARVLTEETPESASPRQMFDRGTWQWVTIQRIRGMNDDQAEDVADYAEYILLRKKTELPVIVRGSGAVDPIVR